MILTSALVAFVFMVVVPLIGSTAIKQKYGLSSFSRDHIDAINDLRKSFNHDISNLSSQYNQLKREIVVKAKDQTDLNSQIAQLNSFVKYNYDGRKNELDQAVKASEMPPNRPAGIRKFWRTTFIVGCCLCMAGCFSSVLTMDDVVDVPTKSYESATDKVWNAETIPMPHFDDETQYVANPDGILSDSTVMVMNQTLRKLDQELDVESAVAVVYHIENDDPFRMAQDMGNRYGVGRSDRGLVIVVGYGDRSINISPGQSLEGDLTDNECARLEDKYVVPFMQQMQPDSAMVYLTQALYELLRHKDLPEIYEPGLSDNDAAALLGMLFFTLLLGIWLYFGSILNRHGLLRKDIDRLLPLLPLPTNNETLRPHVDSMYDDYDSHNRSGVGGIFDGMSGRRGGGFGGFSSGPHGGSYGGGHFGGGGATRRW